MSSNKRRQTRAYEHVVIIPKNNEVDLCVSPVGFLDRASVMLFKHAQVRMSHYTHNICIYFKLITVKHIQSRDETKM